MLREVGDVATPVFPRSSMKPFQALAVLASGAELTEEEHVLATASHAATAVADACCARTRTGRVRIPRCSS